MLIKKDNNDRPVAGLRWTNPRLLLYTSRRVRSMQYADGTTTSSTAYLTTHDIGEAGALTSSSR